ncbi:MAG: exonuclease SbcCD subunit D [Chloroflexi bacterium]|nr:exonuclease SbcCD subunit D [Chloroflexota bacterium]
MSEAIRVLHFADVHIGMENYGRNDPATGLNSRVVDFIRRLDDMVDYARQNDVDLTIFAGDAFKTRAPNPTFQREFAHRVRDLAALAPVVLLVGNHDLPPSALKASSIEIYDTLQVPNVWVADDYELKVMDTKRGSVAVGAAPYPIRARLLEKIPTTGMTIGETDARLQGVLSAILEELAQEADQYDMPRLLTGHFTVNGAVLGSERNIMLGRDVQVLPSALADPRWDYVALGHIHKHQNLTDGRRDVPPVVYSGSIERIDFGEAGDDKGFCWLEMTRGKTRWQFVPLKARDFITLRKDLRRSTNPTDEIVQMIESHHLVGAVVKLHVELSPESESRLNEAAVREALRRAEAHFIAPFRKEIEQPARARLGGSPEGMTHLQLLERYLLSKEIAVERREELLQAALEIFEEAAE